jgi:diguanylate cyclase (GGDEF)-like protein
VLRESIRDPDLVARFGPAELAVVLPGIELASALAICQRMRQAIAEFSWDTVQPGLTVTASVGCVVGRHGARTVDMLARADRQLAAAKDVG